ncbi:MAG: hypothetical protein AAGC60_30575 [Acidobacteriota bacterium]
MQLSERSRDLRRAATASAGALALVAAVTGIALVFGVSAHDTARAVDRLRATALGGAIHDVHAWVSHGLVAGAVVWLVYAFPAAAYRRRSWPAAVLLVASTVALTATGVALANATVAGSTQRLFATHCALLPALVVAGLLYTTRSQPRRDRAATDSRDDDVTPSAASTAERSAPTGTDSATP